MNKFTQQCKNTEFTRRPKAAGKPWVFSFVVKIILICLCISGTAVCRVLFNQKTEELNKEATQIRMKIVHMNREIANLKIKKEELSAWPYISRRITQYNLGLRPADPKQVTHTKIVDIPLSNRFKVVDRNTSSEERVKSNTLSNSRAPAKNTLTKR